MELTSFLIGALLFPLVLTLYGFKKIPAWESRGFEGHGFNWKKIFAGSFLVSFIASLSVYLLTDNPWPAISIAPLAYMLVLGSVTDLKTLKIPNDISFIAYLLPVPIMIACADSFGWLSFGIWFGLIALFFVFVWFGAFGMADLRIMILAGTSVSWWVGADNLIFSFGFAALIQLIAYPLANKFNWGVVKQRKSVMLEIKEKEEAQNKARLAESSVEDVGSETISESSTEFTVETTVESKPVKKVKKKGPIRAWLHRLFYGKSEKEKRFLPFGPALYLAFTLVGIYYASVQVVYATPFFL